MLPKTKLNTISEGKLLASRIPGAKFVTFNSNNHMMFEHEPEFPRLIKCIGDFLKIEGKPGVTPDD
jgi:hypothetical protein